VPSTAHVRPATVNHSLPATKPVPSTTGGGDDVLVTAMKHLTIRDLHARSARRSCAVDLELTSGRSHHALKLNGSEVDAANADGSATTR
jgi:hypothetical protein